MFGEKRPQTFANHSRIIPVFHGFAFGVFCLNALAAVVHVVRVALRPHHWAQMTWAVLSLLVAAALLVLFFATRTFALRLQDRLIRLEMRLRLATVLPDELRSRIPELDLDQLISLRFASDRELPELVRWVLEEKVTDRKAIKSRITDWQPDYLRV